MRPALLDWLRHRRPAWPPASSSDDASQAANLVRKLAGWLGPSQHTTTIDRRIADFLSAPPGRQRALLPSLYLVLEEFLIDANGPGLDRTRLRSEIRTEFPGLIADPAFGLIFEPPPRQEVLLCRSALTGILLRGTELLGGAGREAFISALAWLETVPDNPEHPPPLGVQDPLPSTPDEWVELLSRLAARTAARLESMLGEAATAGIFETIYREHAESYVLLDSFAVIVGLLPRELVDEAKLGLLNRRQVQRLVLDEVERLRETNDLLEAKNAELESLQVQLRAANQQLQQRAAELTASNQELEAFAYSVAHDLKQPLRTVTSFSQILQHRYAAGLEPQAADYLGRVVTASQHMGELIDSLLKLSRVTRAPLRRERVDLSRLAHRVVDDLLATQPNPAARVDIEDSLVGEGDVELLQDVLENLLGNAWKFSRPVEAPVIEFRCERKDDRDVYYVRDNGVGFDPDHAAQLFVAFQRLHGGEFEGAGIGLATVHRIVTRHGGEIWAEGSPGQGATFYFTLG